jgi:hypothetical protein
VKLLQSLASISSSIWRYISKDAEIFNIQKLCVFTWKWKQKRYYQLSKEQPSYDSKLLSLKCWSFHFVCHDHTVTLLDCLKDEFLISRCSRELYKMKLWIYSQQQQYQKVKRKKGQSHNWEQLPGPSPARLPLCVIAYVRQGNDWFVLIGVVRLFKAKHVTIFDLQLVSWFPLSTQGLDKSFLSWNIERCCWLFTGHRLAALSSVTPFSASSKNILALLIWFFIKFRHFSVTFAATMSSSESPACVSSSCGR